MVKLRQLIDAADAEGKPYFAVEFYPPRTDDGLVNLYKRCANITKQKPLYADVTWGAGGSTSDLTLDICVKLKKEFGMEPNMHLTCTNMPVEKLTKALEGAKAHGIDNILALRGDPPAGAEEWTAVEGGFKCALDLIRYIREHHGDHFSIATAGYPEGHPKVINKIEHGRVLSESEASRVVTLDDGDYVCSDEDYEKELSYLKEKVDAGASVIVTQMFFDTNVFIRFVKDCRARGINVPIMPGIMLIQNYGGFKRMVAFCRSRVPKSMLAAVEAVKDNDADLKALGVKLGAEMCRELIAAGSIGLHLYTLNLEDAMNGVLKELGMYKDISTETA